MDWTMGRTATLAALLAGLHAAAPAAYITPKGEPNFSAPQLHTPPTYLTTCDQISLGSVGFDSCTVQTGKTQGLTTLSVQLGAPADSVWTGPLTLFAGEADEHYGPGQGGLVSFSFGGTDLAVGKQTIHVDFLQDLDAPFVLAFGSAYSRVVTGHAYLFYFDPADTVAAGTRLTFSGPSLYAFEDGLPSLDFGHLYVVETTAVPEPGSLLLAGLALAAAAGAGRRRFRSG